MSVDIEDWVWLTILSVALGKLYRRPHTAPRLAGYRETACVAEKRELGERWSSNFRLVAGTTRESA